MSICRAGSCRPSPIGRWEPALRSAAVIGLMRSEHVVRHWCWFLVCANLCLAGCSTETGIPREYAFAARKEVLVRSELDPTSDVRARLRHGERVAVEGRRRALLLVETGDGERGWAREREFVLEPVRVQAEELADIGEDLPDQGMMHAFDTLNVHLDPSRNSPTIFQLEANEGAHLLKIRQVRRTGRTELWYLVRSPSGPVGWALGRRLYAGIPVEVDVTRQANFPLDIVGRIIAR